jgi:hypothetical protein
VLGDLHQILPNPGVLGIELGEGRVVPPGRVVGRSTVGVEGQTRDRVPVEPRRVVAVLQDVVEGEEAATGVVEDPVEHHSDPPLPARGEQRFERSVAAEHRIDVEVVERVVPMIARRVEDRIEIEGIDPQFGQPIEVLDDPPQVAALVSAARGRSRPWLETSRFRHPLRPGEPIGEDLIEDRVGHPRRPGARTHG